jgi:YidC/Oxa1 family membrane protein insertase
MTPWDALLELFRVLLFSLTQLYGGSLGLAIITLSLLVRLALLPWTMRVGRRALAMQRTLQKIQPELQKLQKRYRNDPIQLDRAIQERYKTHGIRPMRDSGLIAGILQSPFMIGVFMVIRQGLEVNQGFLWIANLSRPDVLLALAVTAMGGLMTAVTPTASNAASLRFAIMVSAVITFVMVSRVAAGVALYWGVSSAVGVLQGVILRRHVGTGSALTK